MVVINPFNGKTEYAKVFDTFKSGYDFDKFIDKGIPDGYVIAAACKDECRTNLSMKAKVWFAKMGSEEIMNLKYREGFAFVGIMGREYSKEKVPPGLAETASINIVF